MKESGADKFRFKADSQVLREFYGLTARELLLMYDKYYQIDNPDFRLWMEEEAKFIKENY